MTPSRIILLASLFPIAEAQAQAYERARPDGNILCRSSRTFTYALATSTGHPTAEERAAVQAAVNTWRQAASSCSDLSFEQTAHVTDGKLPFADGRALIVFRPVKCADVVPDNDGCYTDGSCGEKFGCWSHESVSVVNAGTTWSTATREIVGARIELNASSGMLTTVDGPPCPQGTIGSDCVVGDVQSLVTRSIGEALGFALVARTDSTMSSRLDWGDTQTRTIDPGTLQGLCELYPRGQPTPGCTNVVPPDAGTPDAGTPEEPPPPKSGCSATPSVPLLGALVLLLGTRRRWLGL
ncbi:hypothetical protein [Archangium sp.]|uniref:hypothetical protein n=1 Tax=Archangium sp. TaxID=1872627 RepID=UPI00286C94A3|nr:hypothetical protein [Archangium sp.]